MRRQLPHQITVAAPEMEVNTFVKACANADLASVTIERLLDDDQPADERGLVYVNFCTRRGSPRGGAEGTDSADLLVDARDLPALVAALTAAVATAQAHGIVAAVPV